MKQRKLINDIKSRLSNNYDIHIDTIYMDYVGLVELRGSYIQAYRFSVKIDNIRYDIEDNSLIDMIYKIEKKLLIDEIRERKLNEIFKNTKNEF